MHEFDLVDDESSVAHCFEGISNAGNTESKFEALTEYCAKFGLTEVFYGRESIGNSDPILYRKWNTKWADQYEERRYAMWDEARHLGRTLKRPFSLRIGMDNKSERQREFYAEAEIHNRLNGFALPLTRRRGAAGGFSATGVEKQISNRVVLSVSAAAYVFDLTVDADIASEAADEYRITPRQRLFLKLLADGHTHRDIAVIANISEDWAHKMFARLREKLEVRTDAALMCRALELGLLF
ncbi:MAG: autoinducer binding domain-containing protein [Hyphomonadaceae bacterium]